MHSLVNWVYSRLRNAPSQRRTAASLEVFGVYFTGAVAMYELRLLLWMSFTNPLNNLMAGTLQSAKNGGDDRGQRKQSHRHQQPMNNLHPDSHGQSHEEGQFK
jgi:hypothetical protein